ncbi:MAG: hypothetical protein M0R47_21140 [Methylobacter sp.]|uniref:FmdB family zinc ribbon protein n=1 Tax=Methylobacter sp. TaxID=2051955 RepID=UPI0025CC5844|nr:FmdB family zinc ribbon protein [Methylobacter sp.]MCK9623029.1 hypothetical protein [Methylobacter sp.]
MPIYGYNCKSCSTSFDIVTSVGNHQREVECKCGGVAKQVITAPIVIIPAHMRFDAPSGYESPATGRIITNNRQRINDLAESGCIEYEPGMRQDVDRRVVEDDKALDKAVDDTFDREIAAMPTVKRERLDVEMAMGMNAETVRL